MKAKPDPKHLPIYRKKLAQYEAEGRTEQADIQRRLIARMEASK